MTASKVAKRSKKKVSRGSSGIGLGPNAGSAHISRPVLEPPPGPRPRGEVKTNPRRDPSSNRRREPNQERARATVDAILQAAAEVIAGEGFDRASTNRIARRAGVSIGSLYQYFPNKESILASLLEAHHRAVHDVVTEVLDVLEDPATPLADGLRMLFNRLVELHREDPALTRALSFEVPKHRHGGTAEEENRHFDQQVETILRSRHEVRVTDLRSAAILLTRTVECLTRWLGHSAPAELDTVSLIEAAVGMLTGYLEGRQRNDGKLGG